MSKRGRAASTVVPNTISIEETLKIVANAEREFANQRKRANLSLQSPSLAHTLTYFDSIEIPATRNASKNRWTHFSAFCDTNNIPCFPVVGPIVTLFIHLVSEGDPDSGKAFDGQVTILNAIRRETAKLWKEEPCAKLVATNLMDYEPLRVYCTRARRTAAIFRANGGRISRKPSVTKRPPPPPASPLSKPSSPAKKPLPPPPSPLAKPALQAPAPLPLPNPRRRPRSPSPSTSDDDPSAPKKPRLTSNSPPLPPVSSSWARPPPRARMSLTRENLVVASSSMSSIASGSGSGSGSGNRTRWEDDGGSEGAESDLTSLSVLEGGTRALAKQEAAKGKGKGKEVPKKRSHHKKGGDDRKPKTAKGKGKKESGAKVEVQADVAMKEPQAGTSQGAMAPPPPPPAEPVATGMFGKIVTWFGWGTAK